MTRKKIEVVVEKDRTMSLMVSHGTVTHKAGEPCDVCAETMLEFKEAKESGELAREMNKYDQIVPKQYRALDIDETPDRFTGKRRWREGYYFKLEGPSYAFNEGQEDKSRHFLVCSSFADWNMPKQPEFHEIDVITLEEL